MVVAKRQRKEKNKKQKKHMKMEPKKIRGPE